MLARMLLKYIKISKTLAKLLISYNLIYLKTLIYSFFNYIYYYTAVLAGSPLVLAAGRLANYVHLFLAVVLKLPCGDGFP